MPQSNRRPPTLTAWAAQHGITRRMAYYLLESPAKTAPEQGQLLPSKEPTSWKRINSIEADTRLQHAIATLLPKPKQTPAARRAQALEARENRLGRVQK